MSQKPVAVGLLTCEQMIVEESTRNLTPVNCFTQRKLRDFPSEPISFAVVAFLTDGLGDIELAIVLQTLNNMEELYRLGRRFRFEDPLDEYRCVFRVRNFSFPHEGRYQLLLLADGELVAARAILCKRKEQP
jgi:hypothetical protein